MARKAAQKAQQQKTSAILALKLTLAVSLAVAAIAATLTLLPGGMTSQRLEKPQIAGFIWPPVKSLRHFALQDQYQQPFDRQQLRGRWSLLALGFTHCPDICPLTLTHFQQIKKALADGSAKPVSSTDGEQTVQFVFISVDPQRDTTTRLQEYLGYFDAEFVGLSGEISQTTQLVTDLGGVFIPATEPATASYDVSHSAAMHLVSPDLKLVGIFTAPQNPAEIADNIQKIRAFVSPSAN